MNLDERGLIDALVRQITEGKAGYGRIRPMQVAALHGDVDPPTVDLNDIAAGADPNAKPMLAKRFLSGLALVVGAVVYVYQDDRDVFVLGTLTSLAHSGWRYVGTTGQPAFASDFVNYDAAWQTASYRRVGDEVTLRGAIRSGGAAAIDGSYVFTLPAGYLPRFSDAWRVHAESPLATAVDSWVQVHASGVVQYFGPNNPAKVNLSAVRFSVA